jgi:hypothetical protein
MKNKKLTYILLPAVALIWGLILYRVFSHSDDDDMMMQNPVKPGLDNIEMKRDSFAIVANYPDPFLGNIQMYDLSKADPEDLKESDMDEAGEKRKKMEAQKAKERNSNTGIKWPNIRYGGIIRGLQTNRIVGLVKIGQQEYLMSEKDIGRDIEIIALTADSIVVAYQGERKTITK